MNHKKNSISTYFSIFFTLTLLSSCTNSPQNKEMSNRFRSNSLQNLANNLWGSYHKQCLTPVLEKRYESRDCVNKLIQTTERRHGSRFTGEHAKKVALEIVQKEFKKKLLKLPSSQLQYDCPQSIEHCIAKLEYF
ncbi:hypothetical protein OAA91_00615 [Fibrobacterales bacterium]|nr:hypothetical protein [Fibrobacterales bacterium]